MTDKSIAGKTASPDEVERMMRNLCAFALTEPDPMQRYLDLTHQQVVFDGVAAILKRERGKALADLLDAGVPLPSLMESAQLGTAAMVKALVNGAGRHLPSGSKAAKGKFTKAAPGQIPMREVAPQFMPPQPAAPTVAARPPLAPTGRRLLTPEERAALGLTSDGPIARPGMTKSVSAA